MKRKKLNQKQNHAIPIFTHPITSSVLYPIRTGGDSLHFSDDGQRNGVYPGDVWDKEEKITLLINFVAQKETLLYLWSL